MEPSNGRVAPVFLQS